MFRLPKPDPMQVPEKNKVFTGVFNMLIISIPFWLVVAYLIWKW